MGKNAKTQAVDHRIGDLLRFLVLVVLLLLQLSGCKELYEMPAGGGEQKPNQPVVKVQKVIKKKIIFNPLSKVIAKVPPIEEIKLQLMEITKHAYTVGYGKGAGAGLPAGRTGASSLYRLEYNGGDWDQGIDADLNMLVQYNLRTQHKIAERPETRKIIQLRNFPVGKSPPVVYMTGQKNISLGKTEVGVLKEYLTEKHGMLFADNGRAPLGQPVQVYHEPRLAQAHILHPGSARSSHSPVPFPIPFLPYAAPHGGTDALAWVVNGRIVAYYHPGDIGDAWADDHAGVPAQIWEACYQLGTSVIFYGHAEYSKWLEARKIRLIPYLAILFALFFPVLAGSPFGVHSSRCRSKRLPSCARSKSISLRSPRNFISKGEHKAAAAEYDKFLTLYERSSGGPYSLLMWGHCQVKLRLVNTAVRDGFQSVIDYWPDSHEAVVSSFMIGKCHLLNGEPSKADKVFAQLADDFPKHSLATLSRVEMLGIASARKDKDRQVELWTDIAYKTPKTKRPHLTDLLRPVAWPPFFSGERISKRGRSPRDLL